jgi:hypothetical protein
MAMLLMLAFFTDQACELLDDKYQKAREKLGTYKILWNHWQSLFRLVLIASWEELFLIIIGERKLMIANSG